MLSRRAISRIIFSFPVQFVVLLIKKNHFLLLYWIILFAFVTGSLSQKFGIPYLFLDPEYLGTVGFWAFFIMGVAIGSFIMVFNMSSYIVNAHRFPFIATLSRPFIKYCLNNSVVPAIFVVLYISRLISFQVYHEYKGLAALLIDMFGFVVGAISIILVSLAYFFRTNQDIIMMFGVEASDENPDNPFSEHILEDNWKRKFFDKFSLPDRKAWRVDTYLASPFKVKLVRKTDHYKTEMLEKVFNQNHLNAAIIEIIVFLIFIVLGLFKDHYIFQIPAGASIVLIFAMFLMLSSAFRFWLRSWSPAAFIGLLLLLNFLSKFGFFYPDNKAFGLSYEKKAEYSLPVLHTIPKMQEDVEANLIVLDNWKHKFSNSTQTSDLPTALQKPKLILVNCSGGGLRASMWAFRVMQVADSLTNNCFTESTQLITGASGGMIGSAYYRELYLRNKTDSAFRSKPGNYYRSDKYLYNTAKDMLNPIAFSISVSDLFFNFQKFREGNTKYTKDRAYAFEKEVNRNMENVFDKRLKDYAQPERESTIPMMIFTPTVVNDGRRLLVSPQPVSFLSYDILDSNFRYEPIVDGVEFSRMFEQQHAGDVRFTSVLRMSATFPYILPAVSLPTNPPIHIMDAGIRDNTGLKTSLRYLYVFQKWIRENTSGVIFVDIRDSHKERPIEEKRRMTILENLITPFGNIYGNFLTIQDYNMDEAFLYAQAWFKGRLDFLTFELPTKEQEISLSWHLTTREKKSIYNTVLLPQNVGAFEKLVEILKYNKTTTQAPNFVQAPVDTGHSQGGHSSSH